MSESAQVVPVAVLEKLAAIEVTKSALKEAGIIQHADRPVKILDGGQIKRAFTISKDIKLSKGARAKIESAGGKISL